MTARPIRYAQGTSKSSLARQSHIFARARAFSRRRPSARPSKTMHTVSSVRGAEASVSVSAVCAGKCMPASQRKQSALRPTMPSSSAAVIAAGRPRSGKRARTASPKGAKRRNVNSDSKPAASKSTRSKLIRARWTKATSSGLKSCVMSERWRGEALPFPGNSASVAHGTQAHSCRPVCARAMRSLRPITALSSTIEMSAPNLGLLDSPLLEPILLRKASRRARVTTDSARARMRPWVQASRARYSVALELRDPDTQTVALGLLRDAAFFALCAIEVGEPAAPPPASSPKVAWERFNDLPESAVAPPVFAVTRNVFATDEVLAVEALDANEAEKLRPAAEQTVAWLLGLAEVQTPKRLTRTRRLRTLLLGIALTVISWTLISYWLALAALAQTHG